MKNYEHRKGSVKIKVFTENKTPLQKQELNLFAR